MSYLSVCHVTAWQGVRRSCRIAAEALEQVRQLRWGSFGGNPAAPAGGVRRQPGSSAPEVQSISPLELPDCHRAPPAGCAGLPPKLWRQSGSSGSPGSSGGGSWAAVRKLSSGRTIPFSSISLINMDVRESRPKFLYPNYSQP